MEENSQGDELPELDCSQSNPCSVVAFEGLPTPGLAVDPWAVPTVG